MKKILIVGGGIAGCSIAKKISEAGFSARIVEKENAIGGKVRTYGCKASDSCNNCGLCAVGTLFNDVESNNSVRIDAGAELVDLSGELGSFKALIRTSSGNEEESFSAVVVTTGFEDAKDAFGAGYETNDEDEDNIHLYTGDGLERLLRNRKTGELFSKAPQNVGFVLCYGSRSLKERAPYCSQVCCGYATRAAKVVKHDYPEAEVSVFYMDLQAVKPGDYSAELTGDGIDLIRCRPAEISFAGSAPVVSYEDGEGTKKKTFDKLFLCGGIHPNVAGNTALADITGLRIKPDGFFDVVNPSASTGVWLAGCAKRPMSIANTLSDANKVAAEVIDVFASEEYTS